MRQSLLIYNALISMTFYMHGCGPSDECDPEQDRGYCDGNVAVQCGRINDTESFAWKRADCSSPSWSSFAPHCVVGASRNNTSLADQAICSGQESVEPLCYEETVPECKDGKKLSCGPFGYSILEESMSCSES